MLRFTTDILRRIHARTPKRRWYQLSKYDFAFRMRASVPGPAFLERTDLKILKLDLI